MQAFVLVLFLVVISVSQAFAPTTRKCTSSSRNTRITTELAAISRRDTFVTGAAMLFGVAAEIPSPANAATPVVPVTEGASSSSSPTKQLPHISLNLPFVVLGYGMLGNLMLGGVGATDYDVSSLIPTDSATIEECSQVVEETLRNM